VFVLVRIKEVFYDVVFADAEVDFEVVGFDGNGLHVFDFVHGKVGKEE